MIRNVWHVGALADLSPRRVSNLISPVIQRYFSGPLPGAFRERVRGE